MRPCYRCKRFTRYDRPPVMWSGEDEKEYLKVSTYIGGCDGKGWQYDPDYTEPDLGMYCELFCEKTRQEKG